MESGASGTTEYALLEKGMERTMQFFLDRFRNFKARSGVPCVANGGSAGSRKEAQMPVSQRSPAPLIAQAKRYSSIRSPGTRRHEVVAQLISEGDGGARRCGSAGEPGRGRDLERMSAEECVTYAASNY